MKNMGRLFLIFVVFALLAACAGDDSAIKGITPGSDASGEDITAPDASGEDVLTPQDDVHQPANDVAPPQDTTEPEEVTPSDPACRTNADCSAPRVCVVERGGSALEGFCKTPRPGGGQQGDPCTADAECASNLCVESQCTELCERHADCSQDGSFTCQEVDIELGNGQSEAALVCQPRPPTECRSDADCAAPERCLANKRGNALVFECTAPNSGGNIGDACSADADCAQNLCLNGVCSGPCESTGDCAAGDNFACEMTRVNLGGGDTANVQICAPPRACTYNGECRVGEVCRVDRASGQAFCGAKNPGGRQLGDICTTDSGCAENLCYEGRFRDVCAPTCASNADCAKPGYECKSVAVQDGAGGSNSMKICAPKEPPACTSNRDCATGLTCAVVLNATGSALESACVPAGGKASGVACTQDTECASLLCLNGFCSAPCTDSTQCGAEQLCLQTSVSKAGKSKTLKMCETLPEERCDLTGTCSDGVRMCNQIYSGTSNPNAREAYCGMPNQSASGGLGDSCQRNSECRSNICLTGMSDDCSVICTNDSQCGPGQVCTSFREGTSQIGYCMHSCVNNNDCSSLNFTENGALVDHVCNINVNQRQGKVDQLCFRRSNTGGELGANCESAAGGQPDSSLCQGNMCLTNTLYSNTSCTSDAQCPSGDVCVPAMTGSGKRCATQTFRCTRLCQGNSDCTGGEPGNQLTSCSQDVTVDMGNGNTELISTCSMNN